jgi:8-oxo-dGTP pyrophosphatase MutT (NUDIX family)
MFEYKASGIYDNLTDKWSWEPVEWKKKGTIYYSNRDIPDRYWNPEKWKKYHNKYRNIAGCIVLRPNKTSYDVLVVQSYNNKFGFPKGKCDQNETFLEAAMREFKEETGSEIEITSKNTYQITFKGKLKQVTFYVIIVSPDYDIDTFPIADVEITAFGWIPLQDLTKLPLNDVSKRTLNFIKDYIKQIQNKIE